MTQYLDLDDLLLVASRSVGGDVLVRDYGLLGSALARPQTTVFGEDAYPDIHLKAAALLQSLCSNHALIDGNKRLAWAACRTFLGMNDEWLDLGLASEDDRFAFVMAIAAGELSDLGKIAEQLRYWCDHEGENGPKTVP